MPARYILLVNCNFLPQKRGFNSVIILQQNIRFADEFYMNTAELKEHKMFSMPYNQRINYHYSNRYAHG